MEKEIKITILAVFKSCINIFVGAVISLRMPYGNLSTGNSLLKELKPLISDDIIRMTSRRAEECCVNTNSKSKRLK